jgi:hypothetical protein
VTLRSKYTRALNFQNFCHGAVKRSLYSDFTLSICKVLYIVTLHSKQFLPGRGAAIKKFLCTRALTFQNFCQGAVRRSLPVSLPGNTQSSIAAQKARNAASEGGEGVGKGAVPSALRSSHSLFNGQAGGAGAAAAAPAPKSDEVMFVYICVCLCLCVCVCGCVYYDMYMYI